MALGSCIETSVTAASDQHNRLVLVVEDHEAFRTLCRLTLENAGFRVCEAVDGREALELIGRERPDIILLDVMMPRLSGWQVAGALLEAPQSEQIPIIFVTARTTPAERARAYDLGARDYVAKPFDPAVLPSVIETVLEEIDHGERSGAFAETIDSLRAERILGRD
jgi:two-component system, OmpR family, phosphate regulon response regulator PhoB